MLLFENEIFFLFNIEIKQLLYAAVAECNMEEFRDTFGSLVIENEN